MRSTFRIGECFLHFFSFVIDWKFLCGLFKSSGQRLPCRDENSFHRSESIRAMTAVPTGMPIPDFPSQEFPPFNCKWRILLQPSFPTKWVLKERYTHALWVLFRGGGLHLHFDLKFNPGPWGFQHIQSTAARKYIKEKMTTYTFVKQSIVINGFFLGKTCFRTQFQSDLSNNVLKNRQKKFDWSCRLFSRSRRSGPLSFNHSRSKGEKLQSECVCMWEWAKAWVSERGHFWFRQMSRTFLGGCSSDKICSWRHFELFFSV